MGSCYAVQRPVVSVDFMRNLQGVILLMLIGLSSEDIRKSGAMSFGLISLNLPRWFKIIPLLDQWATL